MAKDINLFYKKAFLFWFVLLILAFTNATIRETTYKPILQPYLGIWAHQISSITGIFFFFIAIYYFLKKTRRLYQRKDLINVGAMWILATVIFETFMNIFVRKLSLYQVMQTYYFWRGETWIFVLISLIISPLAIYKKIK